MEPDLSQILQQQLRDIHSPETISLWPPAIGWWILVALVFALIIYIIYQIIRIRKAQAYKRLALSTLRGIEKNWYQHQNSRIYLQEINVLLKRVLLSSGTAGDIGSAIGNNWAYTLRTASKKPLDEDLIDLLTSGLYQPNPNADVTKIHKTIHRWIKDHSGKKERRNKAKQIKGNPQQNGDRYA